ncbi:VWA domain-containing protein [bacterium]|nr:VWA domain-containing protein [bacterium]
MTSSVRTDISKNGIDIAIVFDISKSMLAEDIQPNRITAAKKVMSDFVSRFTSDRLAIVLFAGKPFLSTPLTFDYTALVNTVEQMTTDSIRQDLP